MCYIFFFNDTATTEIYTLSLHDALPILRYFGLPKVLWLQDPRWAMPALITMSLWGIGGAMLIYLAGLQGVPQQLYEDRKSTRLNSSHANISYAVFCLKKKKTQEIVLAEV